MAVSFFVFAILKAEDWKDNPFYPTDHCGVIRVNSSDIEPYYLSMILEIVGKTYSFSRINRVSIERIKGVQIPLPAIDIQQQIVSECEKIDEEYNTSRMTIEEYKKKIAEVFENLEVIVKSTKKKGGVIC